jgi:hypothetical protein
VRPASSWLSFVLGSCLLIASAGLGVARLGLAELQLEVGVVESGDRLALADPLADVDEDLANLAGHLEAECGLRAGARAAGEFPFLHRGGGRDRVDQHGPHEGLLDRLLAQAGEREDRERGDQQRVQRAASESSLAGPFGPAVFRGCGSGHGGRRIACHRERKPGIGMCRAIAEPAGPRSIR